MGQGSEFGYTDLQTLVRRLKLYEDMVILSRPRLLLAAGVFLHQIRVGKIRVGAVYFCFS